MVRVSVYVVICVLIAVVSFSQAYVLKSTFRSGILAGTARLRADTAVMACRRNNKLEKQKRNRDYARKYASKTGESRKKVVVEQKRGIVAANEAKFQAELFQLTTDDDMPAYSGFQFTT